jgi:hypothetical protein
MNREEFLSQSLATWIGYGFKNIIIVDWSSDIPLIEQEFGKMSLTILRIENQKFYNGSIARNVGAKFVKSKWLMMIDSDIKIIGNLGLTTRENYMFRRGNLYYTGKSTFGTFVTAKENFDRIGGYNENMNGWGWEDNDLYDRFKQNGIAEEYFPHYSLEHIDHDDILRTCQRNEKEKDVDKSRQENMEIAIRDPWTSESTHAEVLVKVQKS